MSSCVYPRGWLITIYFFASVKIVPYCTYVSLKFADLY
jgi:hypothetical protein